MPIINGNIIFQFWEILLFVSNLHYNTHTTIWKYKTWKIICIQIAVDKRLNTPLEFVFQEQSYSNLHSGQSLAWDHVRGDIDDPCIIIANFCGVIGNPCIIVTIPEAIGGLAVADLCATRWHRKTSWNTCKILWYIVKHCKTLGTSTTSKQLWTTS